MYVNIKLEIQSLNADTSVTAV